MNSADFSGIGMTSERTRRRMIERLKEHGITDQAILDAMLAVPRHIFVDEAISHRAYEDTALPIGFGQTISQPYIVAKMTSALLSGGRCEKVLEIGTGSGYQTAILSQLADKVYTVERIKDFQIKARKTLGKLKIHNVQFEHGDGQFGLKKHAPYDAIIVTAAPEMGVPKPLLEQLKDGGRIVIPIGKEGEQELKVITREGNGIRQFTLELVRFVPLVDGTQ